ncbi:MAG: hypothetical protein HDR16_07890 [Lachnospiraceae bacterium]|nr:hypothetical protein [Lachnospiraceae bacterium]
MEAPESGESEEVTEPSDEGNFEEITDDISNEDPADEDSVVEEPSEEEVADPTITVYDGDDDTTPEAEEVEVKLPTSESGYTISGATKAAKNQAYTFTVTPTPNYEIISVTYTVADAENKSGLTPKKEGNNYTIPADDVTGNIEITVTADTIKYNVEAVFTEGAVNYNVTEGVTNGKIEVGATLKFTATAQPGNRITEVSYKMGAGNKTPLDLNEEGSYEIENVTGNVQITIKSVKTYTVIFPKPAAENKSNVTAITDIKINNQPADKASFDAETDAEGEWKVSVDDGQKISFKVSTADPFQVKEITIADKTRVATKVAVNNGVYSFTVRADAELTIVEELNPAKCYGFKVTVKGDEGSATVAVKDLDELAGSFALDKNIVTRAQEVVFTVTPADDYEISGVTIAGTTATAKAEISPAEYTAELTNVGTVVPIVVTTTPKASDEKKITVAIADEAEHLTGPVVKADGKGDALTPDDDGVYTVPEGSKTLEIAVTADTGYKPKIDYAQAGTPAVAKANDKKTYTYTILASKIAKLDEENTTPDTVTFTEEAATYGIEFENDDNVNLSVSIDGQEIEQTKYNAISEGETVAIRVEQANDSFPLNGVTYTVGTTAKTVKASKGVVAFTVKMTDDVNVTVDTAEPYAAAPLKDAKNGDKEVEATNGVYSVSYEGTYKVGLEQRGADLTVADVKVFDGKKELAEGVKIASTGTEAPTLELSQAVAGKKLTVKLYVEDDYGDYVDTKAAYTLQVTKVVSKITVPKTAKQPTDTTRTYKVTTDGELSKLDVEVKNASSENLITAEWDKENGEVIIEASQTPGTADVVVTDLDGNKSGTIKFTSEALISDKTAAPTVALKSATDVELSLTVGAKNIDDNLVKGAVYYKVEVTPQGEKKDIPSELLTEIPTQYVKKEGDSKSINVRVAKNETAFGSGKAWKYDVKVSLIHVGNSSVEITDDATADANIVKIDGKDAQSKAFETKNKPFATLEPAWESNLKLKKGQTTLTTGEGTEKPVIIATAQFSKPTTYKAISVSDTSFNGDDALTVVADEGVIKAIAVKGKTAVGKHTIEVIAAAHTASETTGEGDDAVTTETPTMYASKATIVVTVVQGIDGLSVQLPSETVYKAAGKAATLKPTAIFNGDTTGKDKTKQPKVKNVKWELVTTSNAEWTDPKVSINAKNGTVTIAKDYILKANKEANQFKIKVSVDNTKKFAGAADSAITSAPITITNKGAQVEAVAIVQVQKNESDEAIYKVVAKPTKGDNGKIVPTPKEATDINGGLVYAFNTTDIAEEYKAEDFNKVTVPLSDLTFKSSKAKNVAFSTLEKNAIVVNSPANGVKLTVTANDGSKKKAELTLNVNPDTTTSDDLALLISTVDGDEVYNANTTQITTDTVEKAYNGSAVSRVAIQVQAWNKDADGGAKYEVVPKYANYTLKVKKGGKLTGSNNGVYTATLDKRDIEITLTNNVGKKTWTYKLTNEDVLPASAMKITAKALNTLHPEGTEEAQQVTIQLSNVDQTKYEGYTVSADVEVDWSKMNAKNAGDLTFIANNLSEDSKELVEIDSTKKTAKLVLSFDNANHKFTQSSYALKVTLRGTKSEEVDGETVTEEKAVSQPAAVTVKVDKVKKFTFKPTTSYTIGSKDGYAVVSGKSSIPADDLDLKFVKLLNLADKNGQENKFTKNIELTKDGKLKIKTDAKAEDLVAAHLTGYLVYTAEAKTAYYNTYDQSGVVKITVKIKDNASSIKYTHDKASIGREAGATQTVVVKVNSKDAMVAGTVDVVAAKIKSTKDPLEVTAKESKLELKLTEDVDPKKKKTVSADIYIVTSDNKDKATFTGDTTPEVAVWNAKAAVVKVTLSVDSELTISATLKGKITDAINGVIGEGDDNVKITTATVWADIDKKILEAANSAEGVSPNFEVVADDETALTIENGTATIVLTVQQKGLTTNSDTVTIKVSDIKAPEDDNNQDGQE